MSINTTSLKNFLTIALQYVYPHHLVCRLLSFLAHLENEAWKDYMVKRFGKRYKVNTKEAISRNLKRYPSFNSFFTRELKPGARPITELECGVASPADGTVSQAGKISDGELIQAKGKNYTVAALLGGEEQRTDNFKEGMFTTIYLSPRDYHRIHMPFNGVLQETVHIPGRLFSFDQATVNAMPNLYAKNERVVSFFDTEAGPMALVMVGSIFSSSIETVWDGIVTPPSYSEIRRWNYPYNPPSAKKGEEIGRFNRGSTVILLFAKGAVEWESTMISGNAVKMGALIGKVIS
ncbi:archaetidylserine decarboxylase [Methylomarinum sp. Ch1-1]|uniref:Phosphatidylserine decarboxylase proenzyme n=1 Tax=Methylomarinum roseum TaxID=3067653 RepID=A0AAU7NR57_9GAMM|nr:archaetidylserine decarboxylase [Methylomarinum sp. Ch1-1]MDP4520592.1 archaetidylserine decarboxylase [Methylomarinum sp. Ch1-1]